MQHSQEWLRSLTFTYLIPSFTSSKPMFRKKHFHWQKLNNNHDMQINFLKEWAKKLRGLHIDIGFTVKNYNIDVTFSQTNVLLEKSQNRNMQMRFLLDKPKLICTASDSTSCHKLKTVLFKTNMRNQNMQMSFMLHQTELLSRLQILP